MESSDPGVLAQHPTGVAVAGTALGLLLWNKFTHQDFSADEVGIILGLVGAIASALSPRFRRN